MGVAHYLPQPALPEVPGRGGAGLACRARGRAAAGAATSTSSSRCRPRSPPIAYQNKAVVYDLLFKAAAETLLTIAADPRHLGARIGVTAVLHTWGSAMTHHPHVHMIVPGGGISLDGTRWMSCRPGFLSAGAGALAPVPAALPGRARRRPRGRPAGVLRRDRRPAAPARPSPPISRRCGGRTGSSMPSRPSPGPRRCSPISPATPIASPSRTAGCIALDERGVTFRYKDYRRNGQARYRTMTLAADEFIRRFLLHVLPKGFHRIRHYGLLASAGCKANIARARELIAAPMPPVDPPAAHDTAESRTRPRRTDHRPPCPCCGGRMIIVEVFGRGGAPRGPPSACRERDLRR